MNIPWSDEEEEYLQANATSMTMKQLHKALQPISAKNGANRTVPGIYKKIAKFGLKTKCGIDFVWNSENKKYLKAQYGKVSTEELAKHFNRTEMAIVRQANKMGLEKRRQGRPKKCKMIQATPWKEHLCQILAVAEWFDEHGFEVEMQTKGGKFMAVFREEKAAYTDEPLTVYNKLLEEGLLPEKADIDVFDQEKTMCYAGFKDFNVLEIGHAINYEY